MNVWRAEARIGKKEEWTGKDGGMDVKWNDLERPFNYRRRRKEEDE